MSETVYIVRAQYGNYSDRIEWNVVAVRHRQSASAIVRALTDDYQRLMRAYEPVWEDYDGERAFVEAEAPCALDPRVFDRYGDGGEFIPLEFLCSYGVSYYIEKVTLLGGLAEFKESRRHA